jgi:hypothetical protein
VRKTSTLAPKREVTGTEYEKKRGGERVRERVRKRDERETERLGAGVGERKRVCEKE